MTQTFLPVFGKAQHESALIGERTPTIVRFGEFSQEVGKQYGFAIEAECVLCAYNEYTTFFESIGIPASRFSPDSIFYRLIVEPKLGEISEGIPAPQAVDALISQSLHMLFAYRESKNLDRKKYFEDRFVHVIDSLHKRFGQLTGRDQILYAVRVRAFVDKELEEVRRLGNDTLENALLSLQMQIEPHLWYSDNNTFKYIVDVPQSGEYFLRMYPRDVSPVLIDGQLTTRTLVPLEEGIHTISISVPERKGKDGIMRVFLEKKRENTSAFAPVVFHIERASDTDVIMDLGSNEGSVIIAHPTSYDSRWKLEVIKGTAKEIRHRMIDGYANGWLLTYDGEVQIRIYYHPFEQFQKGLFVSGFSIGIIGSIYIFMHVYKRKKYV